MEQYYISISHWGLFPISYEQGLSLLLKREACMIDDYIIILFPKD